MKENTCHKKRTFSSSCYMDFLDTRAIRPRNNILISIFLRRSTQLTDLQILFYFRNRSGRSKTRMDKYLDTFLFKHNKNNTKVRQKTIKKFIHGELTLATICFLFEPTNIKYRNFSELGGKIKKVFLQKKT